MKPTTQKTPGSPFAIELTPDTDLGLAMLIAEADDGSYEPVDVVSSLNEARTLAQSDLRRRTRAVERGESPLCPDAYKVWARGCDGQHHLAAEFRADALL